MNLDLFVIPLDESNNIYCLDGVLENQNNLNNTISGVTFRPYRGDLTVHL